jgi:hypothetical protein
MAATITVITTANRARRFLQSDVARSIHPRQPHPQQPDLLGQAADHRFEERQTEVFSAASIACLEIESDRGFNDYVHSPANLMLMALTPRNAHYRSPAGSPAITSRCASSSSSSAAIRCIPPPKVCARRRLPID